MRIVLDTSPLISALRSAKGASAEVLRLILKGPLVILMDYKLASEYRDVALRPEHLSASGLTSGQVLELIESLEIIADPVEVLTKSRPFSSDPDDDMVLDVAINGNADATVTANTKHFTTAANRFGIAVLSPSELLSQLRTQETHAK